MSQMEPYQLMQTAAEKCINILTGVYNNPVPYTQISKQFRALTEDIQKLMQIIFENPDQLFKMQVDYWTSSLNLMQEQWFHWMQGKTLPIVDKRFASPLWVNLPFFNSLAHHYLIITKHLQHLSGNIYFKDDHTSKRLRFLLNQYLDAVSPANFLTTNPELIMETLETKGMNILKGLNNALEDIDAGTGVLNITMSDKKAFTVGKNLAITPGKIIFKNSMMELIQYMPQTATTFAIPLLIIPPWINKYYILDLSPHNSLIQWLVSQNITVFTISWINPDASYAKKSLYDYMESGPIAALNIIQQQLQVKKINSLGFCIGGTLQAMWLAYNKGKGINSVNTATFLASLIDFSEPGDIAVFIDEEQVAKLEEDMQQKGYLAGQLMASSFNALRANDLIWSFFIKNYLQGKPAAPFDILYWNADSTNMPATMHSQYLRWMYLQNDLIKPGGIKLNGVSLDIHKVNIPTFFVATAKDHIAPWKSAWLGFARLQGKKRFVLGGSGHIAGIINPPVAKKYGYYTNENYNVEADVWLQQATFHEGSWWQDWQSWLTQHSGNKIKALSIKNLKYVGLYDAPGIYVKQ